MVPNFLGHPVYTDDVRAQAVASMPASTITYDPEPEEEPPYPPAGGGGSHMLRGLMLRIYFFLVFLMFSKYLWRYSCIMKSTGSAVTYLIFEFSFQHVWLTCIRVHSASAYTMWKCTVIFSCILNTGPHNCIVGGGGKYNSEAPGRGPERSPGGGAPPL